MALFDTTWYVNFGNGTSTGYYAVPQFATSHAYNAGDLIRQLTAPAVGSERVFVCIVAGTSVAEPTWTVTRGARNTSTTPVFQECTGASAVNGDVTNTPSWNTVKGLAVTLGQIIKRNNAASYQICSTAGTAGSGSEPAFSDTAGTTTVDNTITWTSLGVVSNFIGGGAPHARLTNAMTATWAAAGNKVYVADSSAETGTAGITLLGAGTAAVPILALCNAHAGNYPPQSTDITTGATITNSGAFSFTAVGLYAYGVNFICSGSNSITLGNGALGSLQRFDSCTFQLSVSGGTQVGFGTNLSNLGYTELYNCQFKFASTAQQVHFLTATVIFKSSTTFLIAGGSIPSAAIGVGQNNNPAGCTAFFEGVDFSQINTSPLFTHFSQGPVCNVVFKDCKLNAATTLSNTPPLPQGIVHGIRCDSAGTNYQSSKFTYAATETTEISITRVGGATDGVQTQSRKIVTTANSSWQFPYIMQPLAIWNVKTTSTTVTLFGTINSAALPNTDDIWMDVEYLGDSASPLGSVATTTKANVLAASVANTTDSSTWNGGGSGAGWSPFKMAVTITPGQVGPITVYVKAAKPTTTFYIDPKPVIT
jgi:hypothetical protein